MRYDIENGIIVLGCLGTTCREYKGEREKGSKLLRKEKL
jgi:hypothetical protein